MSPFFKPNIYYIKYITILNNKKLISQGKKIFFSTGELVGAFVTKRHKRILRYIKVS